MGRSQKGKSKKRPKSWHRGHVEARAFKKNELPDVGSGADPTSGAPKPVSNSKGVKKR